jgi:hypothetical protein
MIDIDSLITQVITADNLSAGHLSYKPDSDVWRNHEGLSQIWDNPSYVFKELASDTLTSTTARILATGGDPLTVDIHDPSVGDDGIVTASGIYLAALVVQKTTNGDFEIALGTSGSGGGIIADSYRRCDTSLSGTRCSVSTTALITLNRYGNSRHIVNGYGRLVSGSPNVDIIEMQLSVIRVSG